eukprot:10985223-Karenia_brevis.AAC.1
MNALKPAPPPGAPGRKKWKSDCSPVGPIALMLQQVHFAACCIHPATWQLLSPLSLPLDIMGVPFQRLKPQLLQRAV